MNPGSSYRAILFDLDGTLTDPKVGITRSIQYALGKRGLQVPNTLELESWIGPPLEASFHENAGLDEREAKRAVEDYREYFAETGIFENHVYPGIAELLEGLVKAERRLILATSKPTVYARKILEHFDLDRHFYECVGSFLDGRRVHKPEVVFEALRHVGECPVDACVMIGDREHDLAGARGNDIAAISVGWGYGSRAELERARPEHHVETVEELECLLLF
ncbi:MAG: HAD family hydrolase [bacterium]|nr:HAD family hydrolase [bacterium]